MANKAAQARCYLLHPAFTVVYKLMTSLARATYQALGPAAEPKSLLSRSGAGGERGGIILIRMRTVDGYGASFFAYFHRSPQSGGAGGSLSALLLLSAPPILPHPPAQRSL